MDWPTILGYYAGCDDVWNFAAGGTGFTLGSSLGSVNATAFVAGTFYKINNLGTTNWLSVGWTAANSQQLTGAPAIGDYFYASGPDTAGGTGAANACSLPYLGRLPDIIACNPDLHIIAGSTNDISANQTFRRNAMLAYLQAFRAQSSAPILFFGSIPGSTLSSALITMEQDAQWAIGQMNDETIYFIPTSQDPSPWVNGTGNVGATTGVGNSDVYTLPAGTHPTPNGVIYRAMRYVNAFNAWINSL